MDELLESTKSAVWAKFVKLYPKLISFPEPGITFNHKLRTTAGYNYPGENRVEICYKLFVTNQEEQLLVTIPHELAHQVDWNLNNKQGHGPTWKNIMVAYGLPPVRCHNMLDDKIPDDAFSNLEKANRFKVGDLVQFVHRDRSKKETLIKGQVTKVNIKTVSLNTGWRVPFECPTLELMTL